MDSTPHALPTPAMDPPPGWPVTTTPVTPLLAESVVELLLLRERGGVPATPLAAAMNRLGAIERAVLQAEREADADAARFAARDLPLLQEVACWPVVVELARTEWLAATQHPTVDVRSVDRLSTALRWSADALRAACDRVVREEPQRARDYLALQLVLQRAEAQWLDLVRSARGEATTGQRIPLVALDAAVPAPDAAARGHVGDRPESPEAAASPPPSPPSPARRRLALRALAASAAVAALVHLVAFDALGLSRPRAETLAVPGEDLRFTLRRAGGLGEAVVSVDAVDARLALAIARAAGCPVRLVDTQGRELGTADADTFQPSVAELARQARSP